jgi:predicted DNA-binding protein
MTVASRGMDQFPVRFPDGMRDRLKAEADASGRSMNSEIIHRLNVFDNQEATVADDKKHSTLTVRLTDETRKKLDELSQRGPYRISLTSIVERGIELAAAELEKLK